MADIVVAAAVGTAQLGQDLVLPVVPPPSFAVVAEEPPAVVAAAVLVVGPREVVATLAYFKMKQMDMYTVYICENGVSKLPLLFLPVPETFDRLFRFVAWQRASDLKLKCFGSCRSPGLKMAQMIKRLPTVR